MVKSVNVQSIFQGAVRAFFHVQNNLKRICNLHLASISQPGSLQPFICKMLTASR